jgi:hypothetical protein
MKKLILTLLLTLSFSANAGQAYLQSCNFDGSVFVGTYKTMGGTYFRLIFSSYCPYTVNL